MRQREARGGEVEKITRNLCGWCAAGKHAHCIGSESGCECTSKFHVPVIGPMDAARELTPDEQWARYDDDVELLRLLRARANENNPNATHFDAALRALTRKIAAPSCRRPEPTYQPAADLATIKQLASDILQAPGGFESPMSRLLACEVPALVDEVKVLRQRVADVEGSR